MKHNTTERLRILDGLISTYIYTFVLLQKWYYQAKKTKEFSLHSIFYPNVRYVFKTSYKNKNFVISNFLFFQLYYI